MLFNSYEFILVFLPVTFLSYYIVCRYLGMKAAKYFLFVASILFYSYWDIKNLPLLLFSIAVNIFWGNWLIWKKSKIILGIAIAFNLVYLGYFKYMDFFITNMNTVFSVAIPLQNISLPLGISFFTFTQIAYLVDIYREEVKGQYAIGDYLLFVTIFPHLIAGPILYHKDVISQFEDKQRFSINFKNLSYGLLWFTIGLFKKVIIADKLAVYANRVFEADVICSIDAWAGSFAYTLQLYFDFSGYSEMAVGLGLLFNFSLPINFCNPYNACSIKDFWQRWHITLSSFLKNYLYIPLGGNRTGHQFRNVMITMLLGGLWHGAGWTFVVWGGIHGLMICINNLWSKTKLKLPIFIAWFLTLNVVNIAWVFFRATSFENAYNIISAMFVPAEQVGELLIKGNEFRFIMGSLIFSLVYFDRKHIEKYNPYFCAAITAAVFLYVFSKLGAISEFLYFQF